MTKVFDSTKKNEFATEECMKSYGYMWDGMIRLSNEEAKKIFSVKSEAVYMLYPDGTESVAESIEDINYHIKCGGILGIEKESWNKYISLKDQKTDLSSNTPNPSRKKNKKGIERD